ncbi:hypothetical protein AB0B40_38185 [Streptomyces sp. NPDC042638]|uniref:hypothetical protein n=1 Tax=Streptomyces sp. NPDC042638 TaxID=3154333 RepID=UPI0033EA03E3
MTSPGGLLPPIGLEIPCSSHAAAVPLKIDAIGLVQLDFKGGIRLRVESNIGGGFGGVRLKIIGEEYSADSPVLGRVTLSQADIDTTPLSLLEIVSNNPPTFKNTLFHDFTLSIEKFPGSNEPMVLANTKTMTTLNSSLRVFPPQGDVYQMQEPVGFAPVGDPGKVVAQLMTLPITRAHNP